MSHPTDDELIDYAQNEVAPEEQTRLREHLADCAKCATALGEYEVIIDGLKHEPEAMPTSEPPANFLRQLKEVQEAIEEDRASTQQAVEALRKVHPITWPEHLRPSPAAVEAVLDESQAECERSPQQALTLATHARRLAEQLPATSTASHRAWLLGSAWKATANALRYLNQYTEALDAANHAEAAYAGTATPDLDQATAAFVRASILVHQGLHAEARAIVSQVIRIFAAYGEDQRSDHARFLAAVITYEQGDARGAYDQYVTLRDETARSGDESTHARVMANLGACAADLGKTAEANTFLNEALRLYEQLGITTEQARTRWAIADLLLQQGKLDEGRQLLEQTRQEFTKLGMPGEAGMVELHQLETLLALENTAGLAQRCRTLVERFTKMGVPSAAHTALAYLQESLDHGTATPTIARHVRMFLTKLEHDPRRPFAPPQ